MATSLAGGQKAVPPKVYNIYIFNREGVCLYYREWYRTNNSQATKEEDCKIVFGLFWAMQQVAAKLDPTNPTRPDTQQPFAIGEHNNFRSFTANNYKLHFMNTPSGVKIALNTAPSVGSLEDLLQTIYAECYVEHVIKNPAHTPGQPFNYDGFNNSLQDVVRRRDLL